MLALQAPHPLPLPGHPPRERPAHEAQRADRAVGLGLRRSRLICCWWTAAGCDFERSGRCDAEVSNCSPLLPPLARRTSYAQAVA